VPGSVCRADTGERERERGVREGEGGESCCEVSLCY
jgi:hypothetical protein